MLGACKKGGTVYQPGEYTQTHTHLDDGSSPSATQHRHLAGIDAVGPVLSRMVHAQDPVQHLLFVTVAWGRDHAVGT